MTKLQKLSLITIYYLVHRGKRQVVLLCKINQSLIEPHNTDHLMKIHLPEQSVFQKCLKKFKI